MVGFWTRTIFNLWLYFQSLLINLVLIIYPENPAKAVNLSAKRKQKLGYERLELIRSLTARFMWLINTLTTLLLGFLVRGIIDTALGYQERLGWEFIFILGVLLIVTTWLVIKILMLSRIPEESDSKV